MRQFISDENLDKLHRQIDTPALLIFEARLERNIRKMQEAANRHGKRLRPHIKTHKSVDIARMQMQAGASGLTVAKLGEAEVLAAASIDDLFIANQITHPLKLKRLRQLTEKHHIIVGLDHPRQVELLDQHFKNALRPLTVRIEIDSGLQRCGVEVNEDLVRLAEMADRSRWLTLEGIFTHAGHVYSAASEQEIEQIGRHEGQIMEAAMALLSKNGIALQTVSVGSTPTAPYAFENHFVNEVRPGNYVFNDAIQVRLGAAKAEACSLFVLATVTSKPADNRIVIDAGSKALNLDRGAHAMQFLSGYGTPVNLSGAIVRLSEEHGIIEGDQFNDIGVGSPVLILPNHACAVSNLFDQFHLIDYEYNISTIPVSARGKSR